MGVTSPIAEFLLESRLSGTDFSQTLTLGRQALFVSPARLRRLLRLNGAWPSGLSARDFYSSFEGSPGYVDPFLRCLGADEVHVMDASTYEGASIVHDLNQPIPGGLAERYSVVFDGGTLEHVFNFPVALQSCMQMLRPGGRLFLNVVANQQLGHGMYQFSPELFFRALAEENGFILERMHAYEGLLAASSVAGVGYEFQFMGPRHVIRDPLLHAGRHELFNQWPLALMIEARKSKTVPIFSRFPQQSDYAATWTETERSAEGPGGEPVSERTGGGMRRVRAAVVRRLPPTVKTALWIDVIPWVARPFDPLRFRRARRRATLSNLHAFPLAPRLLVRPSTGPWGLVCRGLRRFRR